MGRASRDKGRRYEQEVAKWYRAHGCEVRRGWQSRAGNDEPDVILESVPCGSFEECTFGYIWIECKHHARMGGVHRAYKQARDAAGEGRTVIVHTHEDNGEHLVTVSREDFAELVGF